MIAFLSHRILGALPVLFVILLINFAILHLPGTSGIAHEIRPGEGLTTAELERRISDYRAHHGLDEPVHERFVSWLGRAARFDFGRSMVDSRLVKTKIAAALPATILLQGLALLTMFLVGIPLGVLMAARRGSILDQSASVALYVLYSVPAFWLATLLIIYLATDAGFDLFPLEKLSSRDADQLNPGPRFLDLIHHLVLPVFVLAVPGVTVVTRQTRNNLLEALSRDYVRTARAAGLSERVVVGKYALRNSLIPLAVLLGELLPLMVGGSVVVETIFNVNGMGLMVWQATFSRDYPVLQAAVLLTALCTLLGFFLSDILTAALDPRLRAS